TVQLSFGLLLRRQLLPGGEKAILSRAMNRVGRINRLFGGRQTKRFRECRKRDARARHPASSGKALEIMSLFFVEWLAFHEIQAMAAANASSAAEIFAAVS